MKVPITYRAGRGETLGTRNTLLLAFNSWQGKGDYMEGWVTIGRVSVSVMWVTIWYLTMKYLPVCLFVRKF